MQCNDGILKSLSKELPSHAKCRDGILKSLSAELPFNAKCKAGILNKFVLSRISSWRATCLSVCQGECACGSMLTINLSIGQRQSTVQYIELYMYVTTGR